MFGNRNQPSGIAQWNQGSWGLMCDYKWNVIGWPSAFCRSLGYTQAKNASFLEEVPYMDLEDIATMEVNFLHVGCPFFADNFSLCSQRLQFGPCSVNGSIYIVCES